MAQPNAQLDLGVPVYSFTLTTETTKRNLVNFPKFLIEYSKQGRFGPIAGGDFNQIAGERGKFLVFKATRLSKFQYSASVRIKLDSPMVVDIFSAQGENKEFDRRLEDYLILSLQVFEESTRKGTLYMGFVPGSERTSRLAGKTRIAEKLFRGNMLNIFLIFIVFSLFLFLFLQALGLDWIAPIVMLAVMLAVLLSAGKVIAVTSDWRITKEHPEVAIIEIRNDGGDSPNVLNMKESDLSDLKRKIYDIMTGSNRQLSSSEVSEIFRRYGLDIPPEQIIVKRVNVYEIVKKAASRFNMVPPTVVVTRNPAPNAAAMGFTRRLATMMVTFGLLVQLEEREIELVVGHELSHLRFGDPIVLFSFITAEYLLRVYVLIPNVPFLSFGTVFMLYFIFIFWLIFFFGKFLEARADLESAYILKDPRTMANSLKKIGFKRLLLDDRFIEGKQSTFGDWLAFDPHPPIGFRIRRLESLDMSQMPEHPFLRSVKDVFKGLTSSLR
jgi:heat shock protein HtpX